MTEVAVAASQPQVRFIIVDDHAMVVAGVDGCLAKAFPDAEICAAASVEAALRLVEVPAAPGAITVVLLDLMLGPHSGLEFLRVIRDRQDLRSIRAIVYSGIRSQDKIDQCRMHGAKGYICKADDPESLLSAVRAVLAGREYFTSGDVDPFSDFHAQVVRLPVHLQRVYEGIVEGKSDKDIARVLDIQYSTVKGYTNQIYRALGVKGRKELLVKVRR